MRAWVLAGGFGVDCLTLVDRERQQLGAHEVRVRMEAASLNYRDLLMVRGEYNPRLTLPLVPASDGAGVVSEVGASVSRFREGDRVMPLFAQGWYEGPPTRAIIGKQTLGGPVDGCLTEEFVASEADMVRAPAALTAAEAATLPCAGLTAWSALVTEGNLRAGQSVLVQGSGGVSVFALQLAKALGARVLATTTSAHKAPTLRELGADEVLDVKQTPEWGREARTWAGGDGVDHVLDVGGASTLNESLKAVRPGGTVSLIGNLGGSAERLNLLPILMQNVRVQGVFVGHRASFEAFARFLDGGVFRPVVDAAVPFAEAKRAFERLASRDHFGKVVISF